MKKMDLYQKVVTLDIFVKMVKENKIPIAVVLDEVELNLYKELQENKRIWSKFLSDKYVSNLYYITSIITDDSSNRYMLLNINKLKEYIDKNKIKIENFIDQEDNKNIVVNIWENIRLTNKPITIHYIDEKDHKNIKKVDLRELQISTADEYIKEENKIKKYPN